MRRAERVVHVKITERGERLGESRVVPFLTRPEAGVLDERDAAPGQAPGRGDPRRGVGRSEEHTSELQSRLHLVCRLLLEKKKNTRTARRNTSLSTVRSGSH